MIHYLKFDPFPGLTCPHKQTIIASLLDLQSEPLSVQKILTLSDGDQISLHVSRPKSWKPTDYRVLLVHGMCGSHESSYLVRMVKRLNSLGIESIRYNMRGCGSGKGIAKQIPHCGLSSDICETVKLLKQESPESPILLVGFSLGGNIDLKACGEMNRLAQKYLEGVIAINPPLDIYECTKKLSQVWKGYYSRKFAQSIKKHIEDVHNTYNLPPISFSENITIHKLNKQYKAKACGFANPMDYYKKSSCSPYLSDISIPCRILLSEDDPFIVHSTIDSLSLSPHVEVFKTKHGGHLGYLGNPFSGFGFRYMDGLLEQWIKEFIPT